MKAVVIMDIVMHLQINELFELKIHQINRKKMTKNLSHLVLINN